MLACSGLTRTPTKHETARYSTEEDRKGVYHRSLRASSMGCSLVGMTLSLRSWKRTVESSKATVYFEVSLAAQAAPVGD